MSCMHLFKMPFEKSTWRYYKNENEVDGRISNVTLDKIGINEEALVD